MAVELLSATNNFPEKYVHKYLKEPIAADLPYIDVPSIDIGLLTSSSPEAAAPELNKLRLALSSCGYFQAINHGVEKERIDQMRDVAKRFFSRPLEERQNISRTADDTDGFGEDPVGIKDENIDWTSRLFLTVYPEDERRLHIWPQNPPEFKETLLKYMEKLRVLGEELLKAMAKSLELEENCFLKQYGDRPEGIVFFNFYPPCPKPELTLGNKAHGDASAFTFLLQDEEVEGLQVLKDGQWFRVPIVTGALLVNPGDQIQLMTNGIFKSPIHRAVTNSKRRRYSIALLFNSDKRSEIGPAEELIDEKRPRKYNNIVDYTANFFVEYSKGMRVLDTLEI